MRRFSTDQAIRFTVTDTSGKHYEAEAKEGDNLMTAAMWAGAGFQVVCGGNAECCTCHVYLTKTIVTSQDYIEPETKEIDALDWAEAE